MILSEFFGYASLTLFLGTIFYYPSAKLLLGKKHVSNAIIVVSALLLAALLVFLFVRIHVN